VERGCVFCACLFPTFQGSRIMILIFIRSNNFTAFYNFLSATCRAGRRTFLNDRLELRELGSLGGTSTKMPPIHLRRQFGVSGGSCTPRKLRVGHCFGALFAPPTGAVCVPLCNLQLELSLKSATFHLLRGRNLFCISAARGRIFRDCFNGFEFSS